MPDTCPLFSALFSALQVPLLTIAQVSHYNPQVADWTKEMIEVENQHKREARLLLFVVNGQTRSIASLIELAGTAALSGTQLSINCRNRRMYECTNILRLLSPSFAFFRLPSPSEELITKGRRVVLVVEDIVEGTMIDGVAVTVRAVLVCWWCMVVVFVLQLF